ncbi:MAG: CPBP family intramembrane glutamic endopeptidase [Elusimicrobiota bacterium]|nr:CPBP family intramembrane glutamic endopeptidase [Elusimicrobiota bacterium]
MMTAPSRALVAALAAALSLSSVQPAAAAIARVAPIVPVNAVGMGAAGAVRVNPVSFTPSGPNLTAPSLSAGVRTAPLSFTAPVPTDSAFAAAPVAPAAADAPRVASVLAPARAAAAPADAAKPATVIAGVETAFTRLQGAKDNGPAASAAVLDQLFEGFDRKAAANDAPAPTGLGTEGRGARLAPAATREAAPANGPRWVLTEEKPSAPKTSWKRTAAVGYLAAVVPLVVTAVIVTAASLLGHELNPNYTSPAEGMGDTPSLLQAGMLFGAAAILAPIAEEIVFRAGLQGGLAKLTKFMRLGSFWVPAALVSLLFVAIHETSDPVLITTRFIHAMVLAWAFKKEGLLASMAAHGIFNGLLTLPILAAAGVGALGLAPEAAGLMTLGVLGAAFVAGIVYAVKAVRYLLRQRADRKSGAVAPKPFTPAHGWLALVIMAAGFFLLMPNLYWLAGMIFITPWLAYKFFTR